jgi:hypothetical protein
LNRHLPEQWIGWGVSTSWSLWSPDLTSLRFFLWSFMKDEVYILLMPITQNNLKDWVWTVIAKINQPLLQNVQHKVECCLDVCRAVKGAHIELA